MIYFWALLMGVVAVICEALYRHLHGPWLAYAPLWIPLHLLMGYLVYQVVTSADSLLGAFVVGNFVTSTMRLLVTLFILKETVKTGTWIAFGLLVLAQIARSR